jgi:replication-associated recombination protein RarA
VHAPPHSCRALFISTNDRMKSEALLAARMRPRALIDAAQEHRRLYQKKTTLFVDEVHRWIKAQQDALLPYRVGQDSGAL